MKLFGVYKTNYRNGRIKSTKLGLEGKMLNVLKAWHTTVWPVTIWNAWQVSGVLDHNDLPGSVSCLPRLVQGEGVGIETLS
jgi:hypothetical protein